MEYAVIRTGGKQYRVKPGDILEVDRLSLEKDKTAVFSDVLLWVSDAQTQIGTPTLANVSVHAKVLGDIKGEKIDVAKFKSKVRYRRVTGFRASLTRVQIETIGTGKAEKAKEVTPITAPKSTRGRKASAATAKS